jgi:hypothetical protein
VVLKLQESCFFLEKKVLNFCETEETGQLYRTIMMEGKVSEHLDFSYNDILSNGKMPPKLNYNLGIKIIHNT